MLFLIFWKCPHLSIDHQFLFCHALVNETQSAVMIAHGIVIYRAIADKRWQKYATESIACQLGCYAVTVSAIF
ncbi:MAG: hypothetical protein OIF56_01610 [Cohaesibacter sp.]|nr:hypothetical protein [Cohaesibacter sp.]